MADFIANGFDQLFSEVCHEVNFNYDFECSPRGQKIREILVGSLLLKDPRKRLVNHPARKTNFGFAVGEFLWYWRGAQDLETMLYYNKRMDAFSNDGKTLNSAYGHRIFTANGWNQWDIAVKTLREDPDSRRAILLINEPTDEFVAATHGSKDVPCTLSLQFFIRGKKLHLHAVMRSNDVMWGLTYDAFSFTMLQECMLLNLRDRGMTDLELGSYYHTAGSMHIYERHFEMAGQIAKWEKPPVSWKRDQGMEPLTSLAWINELCVDEKLLREGEIQTIDLGKYRGGERWMAERLNEHRVKRDSENDNGKFQGEVEGSQARDP